MNKFSKIMATSAALAFVAGASTMVATASAGDHEHASKMEKCYGINAAGKNDCASNGHACAGMAKTANSPNEFVEVPEGTCAKIAGGKVG